MSVNYREIIKNLKDYIQNNFIGIELDKNFEVDNGVYGVKYIKTVEEKEIEEDSLNWLKNMEFYFSESIFVDEKILLARYINDSNPEKVGGYIIYLTQDDIRINRGELGELIQNTSDVVDEVDLGIFLLMFKKEEHNPLINKNISSNEVQDILDIPYNEQVNNHSYDQIRSVFSNMYIFKINDEYLNVYTEEKDKVLKVVNKESFVYKFLGTLKCLDKIENINRESYFSKQCLDEYFKLFSCDIKSFPYENLYLSLCHNSPKFIYLEIYRMIEKLYEVIFSYHVKNEFQVSDRDLLEINRIMEKKYKVRHSEFDSIASIFDFASQNTKIITYFNELKKYKNQIDVNAKKTTLCAWIYKIRNTCVHLSFNKEKDVDIKLILNNDTIIKNLIPFIGELYESIFD